MHFRVFYFAIIIVLFILIQCYDLFRKEDPYEIKIKKEKRMNNLAVKSVTANMSRELDTFISKNGKYGCIIIGMLLLYDLSIKAMERDYAVKFSADKEKGIDFNLSKPQLV